MTFNRFIGSLFAVLAIVLSGVARPDQARADAVVQQGPDAAPVTVSVRNLPAVANNQGALPFRHPAGAAALAAARQIAPSIAPRSGIQSPLVSSTTTTSPSGTGTSFDGIDYSHSSCGCYPPDGAIAAGPTYVLASVNTAYEVFDKSGHAQSNSLVSLPSLFSQNSGCKSNDSDPELAFDSASSRYIVAALTYDRRYSSVICIAVTTPSDVSNGTWAAPGGWTWNVYAFPVTSSATNADLLDYPRLGLTSDAIIVNGNQFYGGKTWAGPRVYAYNKTSIYSGATASSVYVDNLGTQYDTLTPARGYETSSTAYLIAADNNSSSGSTVNVWRWTDPFGGGTWSYEGAASIASYSAPINPPEKGGGTLDVGDLREMGAYYYNGTIYGSHDISCIQGGTTADCIQWYQIGNLDHTSGAIPSTVQQGIYGGSDGYRFYPNLVVDSSGDLLLGYDFSSSTDYPGVRYTGRRAADVAGSLGTESTLVAGQANANGGRWGDYSGTFVDPSDGCTAWHLGEYGKSGQLWGTWIGSFSFCGSSSGTGGSLSFTSTPQTLIAGAASGAITVTLSQPAPAGGTSVAFNSSSSAGSFSSTSTGTFTSTLSVPVAGGASTATAYYKDTQAGTPTITAAASGYTGASQQETVSPTPLFSITVSPSSATVPTGGSQLFTAAGADQYGNAVAINPTWALSSAPLGTLSSITGTSTTYTAGNTIGTDSITASQNGITSNSATITIASGTLQAPTNLTVALHHWISLSWSDSQSGITFNVYRGATSGGESPTPYATGVTTTSFTDKTTGSYCYTVRAVNGSGTLSGASNEACS